MTQVGITSKPRYIHGKQGSLYIKEWPLDDGLVEQTFTKALAIFVSGQHWTEQKCLSLCAQVLSGSDEMVQRVWARFKHSLLLGVIVSRLLLQSSTNSQNLETLFKNTSGCMPTTDFERLCYERDDASEELSYCLQQSENIDAGAPKLSQLVGEVRTAMLEYENNKGQIAPASIISIINIAGEARQEATALSANFSSPESAKGSFVILDPYTKLQAATSSVYYATITDEQRTGIQHIYDALTSTSKSEQECSDMALLYRSVVDACFPVTEYSRDAAIDRQSEHDTDFFASYRTEVVRILHSWEVKTKIENLEEEEKVDGFAKHGLIDDKIASKASLTAVIMVLAFLHRWMLAEDEGSYMTRVGQTIRFTSYCLKSVVSGLKVGGGTDSALNLATTLLGAAHCSDLLSKSDLLKRDWKRFCEGLESVMTSDPGKAALKASKEAAVKMTERIREKRHKSVPEEDETENMSKDYIRYLLMEHETFNVSSPKFLKFQIRHNGYTGLGAMLFRPSQTYNMGSAIYMHGGGKAAWTLAGHNHFRAGRDTARDLIMGSYSLYFKTIITSPKHIIIARDILPKGYRGGNGTQFWDPLDTDDVDEYFRGVLAGDIFACAVPLNFKPRGHTMDITGTPHPSAVANRVVDSDLSYPTAHIYRKWWKWAPVAPENSNSAFFVETSLRAANTTVSRAVQFNRDSKGEFSRVTLEKSHWGENVYEGVAKVRSGKEKFPKQAPYLNQSMSQCTTIFRRG